VIPTLDAAAIVWSASTEERAGRPLLLAMHGRTGSERRLLRVADAFPAEFVVAHLRGPWAEEPGWSWFAPDNAHGDPRPSDAVDAAAAVLAWLDTLPTPPLVGALGFSQGGAMALELLRADPDRIPFAVNLGGYAARGERPRDTELRERRPPVLWGRGGMDEVIRPETVDRTAAWLDAHTTATTRLYPRLRHTVSRQEAEDAGAFLTERLVG
jgi:phospholipase/carboxylesterase